MKIKVAEWLALTVEVKREMIAKAMANAVSARQK